MTASCPRSISFRRHSQSSRATSPPAPSHTSNSNSSPFATHCNTICLSIIIAAKNMTACLTVTCEAELSTQRTFFRPTLNIPPAHRRTGTVWNVWEFRGNNVLTVETMWKRVGYNLPHLALMYSYARTWVHIIMNLRYNI